jgi:hypothetical protein
MGRSADRDSRKARLPVGKRLTHYPQTLQQCFIEFIPNEVLALPTQPFGDDKANTRLTKNDACMD